MPISARGNTSDQRKTSLHVLAESVWASSPHTRTTCMCRVRVSPCPDGTFHTSEAHPPTALIKLWKHFSCSHTIDAPILSSVANVLTRHGLQGRVSARCSFPVTLLLTICRPLLWLQFLSPDVRLSPVLFAVSHVSACFSVPAAEQHNPGVQQFSCLNLISYRRLSAVGCVVFKVIWVHFDLGELNYLFTFLIIHKDISFWPLYFLFHQNCMWGF